MKTCSNCIWYDKCGDGKACEYYTPSSQEEEEADGIEEYTSDLRTREALYDEQIKEQQS